MILTFKGIIFNLYTTIYSWWILIIFEWLTQSFFSLFYHSSKNMYLIIEIFRWDTSLIKSPYFRMSRSKKISYSYLEISYAFCAVNRFDQHSTNITQSINFASPVIEIFLKSVLITASSYFKSVWYDSSRKHRSWTNEEYQQHNSKAIFHSGKHMGYLKNSSRPRKTKNIIQMIHMYFNKTI